MRSLTNLLLLMCIILVAGCTTLQEPAGEKPVIKASPQSTTTPKLETAPAVETKQEAPPEQKMGVVFGRAQFEGLLQTKYVRLIFVDISDPQKRFQIVIGDSEESNPLLEEGYFFVELPVGSYRFSAVAIPVGSTQAVEEIDVRFDVVEKKVSYLGTLKLTGTKERVRLGGLPVIRPGFEYTYQIVDERQEATKAFMRQYPSFPSEMIFRLMHAPKQP